MEAAEQDDSGVDHGAAAIQKDVSVGRWKVEMGLIEITVKRGKLWASMGVIRNSKLYCHVEEAVYMVEQESLVLLRGEDDIPISHQELYDFLVVPGYGCSWDAYQIFCHLKRLGYIVGRYGTPWSTTRPKGRPTDLTGGVELQDKSIINSANSMPKSGEMNVEDRSSSQRSIRRTVSERVDTTLSRDAVESFDDEKPKGLPSLFSDLQLSEENPDLSLKKEQEGDLKLMFDVHHPNGRFKKTAPGYPAFTLCIVKGQATPERRQVCELQAMIGGRPLKFGTVDCGHVSIFSFTTCCLPTLP